MAKKITVRMHCKICNKNTVHEIRTDEGLESYVCLVCESMPIAEENAAERDLRRYESQKFKTQTEIERERMRIWSPG